MPRIQMRQARRAAICKLVFLACLALAALNVRIASAAELAGPAGLAGYRLGPGDRIRVITYGEPALSGEFAVEGTGKIAFPLLGQVQAAGSTVPELQTTLEGQLKGDFVADPKVTIEVLKFRPYYILGEVESPGEYPYSNGLTVINAVATAKGFTLRANKKKVVIKHADGTSEVTYRLTPTLPVLPGDTIRIKARFF